MVYCYLIYNVLADVYEDYMTKEELETGKQYVNDSTLFTVVKLDDVIRPEV
jgi:hypothetical protein